MTSPGHRSDDDLRQQLPGLFDGELGDEEFEALTRRLREDPEARAAYFEAAALEVNLEQVFAPPLGRGAVSLDRRRADTRRLAKRSLFIAAAVALLIGAIMTFFRTRTEPALVGVRVCGNSEWAVDGLPGLASAGLIPGSELVLEQGVAELVLPDDTRAVVEAPAVVRLLDGRTLGLDRGRAFFQVASAKGRGFTVVTPQQRIVDLGTAFGVLADGGRTELHLFEGRVRIDDLNGGPGEVLAAPRAVRLSGTRVRSGIQGRPTAFLRELPPKVETVFEEDFETGLAPGKEYAVILGPDLVRDLNGNRFAGMEDPEAWTFRTGDAFPVSLPVRNPGFEEDGERRGSGDAVAAWHPGAEAWGWGVDESRGGLVPTEGRFFGRVFKDFAFIQNLEVPIVVGTTYALKLDVGLAGSAATISLFGSDAGPGEPLVEETVASADAAWKRDRMLFFTAGEEHATGQTLGIALKRADGHFAAFDRVRLGASGPTTALSLPSDFAVSPDDPDPDPGEAVAGPVVEAFHPASGDAGATPGGLLAIRFDEPVRFGFGHLVVRNITDWRESRLMAADPRMRIEGSVLTLRPPIALKEGERHLGRISGWECDAWAGVFNPAGDGTWYRNPELRDGDGSGGTGTMRGQVMATFADAAPGTSIRREVARIEEGMRYSVRVGVGVRDPGATDPAVFDGYNLRLLSGETVLAGISGDSPPGPPNRVTMVGFSWDASDLPEGVRTGDPLWLDIAPNQTSADRPGYLDLDHVKVTRLSP